MNIFTELDGCFLRPGGDESCCYQLSSAHRAKKVTAAYYVRLKIVNKMPALDKTVDVDGENQTICPR